MKAIQFLAMACLTLTMGACSNDELPAPDISSEPGFNAEGKGYLNVSINLPVNTQPAATRAENDKTDDGDASEYAVKDATLILFKGENANTATFEAAYDMQLSWNQGLDNDQITEQGTKVQEINAITTTTNQKIYALAVLNRNNVFTVDNETHGLTIGTTAFSKEKTFADFTKETVSNVSAFNGNGFYMANAVLTDKPGSADMTGAQTTILVDVSNKIYSTEADANKNPAVDIMVERGVAKVDLTQSSTDEKKLEIDENTTLTYSISGWALANQNISSYLVRNWNQAVEGITTSGDDWYKLTSDGDRKDKSSELTANPYRFAGTVLIKEDSPTNQNPSSNYYRTYWGIDPNYKDDASFSDVSSLTFDSNTKYCLENTFDVARQNVKNTTCAIVKAKFTLPESWSEGTSFYTINDNHQTIYKKTDAANFAASQAMTMFSAEAEAALKKQAEEASQSGTITITAAATLSAEADATTKKVSVASVTFTGTISGVSDWTTNTYTLDSDDLAALNAALTITEYTNGESYYTVLIKHFGDELTPWNRDNKEESYPNSPEGTANNNWLGRYGVLRNNWYQIEVSKITGIGSATVPNVNTDTTPDDEIANYISCRINVLSWAVRKQSVELK